MIRLQNETIFRSLSLLEYLSEWNKLKGDAYAIVAAAHTSREP